MLVRDIPEGSILWSQKQDENGEYFIYGIKGKTLPEEFYDYQCIKVGSNKYDYELIDDYQVLFKIVINKLFLNLDHWIELLETDGANTKNMVLCDMQYLKKELEKYEY